MDKRILFKMNSKDGNGTGNEDGDYYSVKLHTFVNAENLYDCAAKKWTQFLNSKSHLGKSFSVALSGGRSAPFLFKAMASHALGAITKNRKIEDTIKLAHFFWADERCVPPDDSESNFGVARQYLLQPLKIKTSQIHRICGEVVPEKAAQMAEEELLRYGEKNSKRIEFDLVMLGMGEDGHVASLFPSELVNGDSVVSCHRLYRSVVAVKPPPNRITLGYKPIIGAKKVWVVIIGKNKHAALADSLLPLCKTPLGVILKHRSETEIFYCPF